MYVLKLLTNVEAFLQSASLAKSPCDDGNLALVAEGTFELLQSLFVYAQFRFK